MSEAGSQPDIDLFSDEVRANPYPHYLRLRAGAPVYWSRLNRGWVVTRYEHALSVLTDSRVVHWAVGEHASAAAGNANYFARVLGKWLALLDPRSRSLLRKLTSAVFAPHSLGEVTLYAGRLAEGLLDDAEPHGSIDVVGGFADPLALAVISKLIGVPDEHAEEFRQSVRETAGQLFGVVGRQAGPARGDGHASAFAALIKRLLREERNQQGNNLIAAMHSARGGGDSFDDDEFVAFLVFFLFAGHENVVNFIGNAVHALARSPEQFTLLRERPELTAGAVEELLRYDSAVQVMMVTATEELRVGGQEIPGGHPILVCIGSANRDPARFEDPDRLDITRRQNGHLSFGQGPLTCLGAALARMEGQLAIRSLARRVGGLTIRGPLRWRRNPPVIRGLSSLVIELGR